MKLTYLLIIVLCFFGCEPGHPLYQGPIYNLQINGDCGDFESDIDGINPASWVKSHDTLSFAGDSSILLHKSISSPTSLFAITDSCFTPAPFQAYIVTAWVKVNATNPAPSGTLWIEPLESIPHIVQTIWKTSDGSAWRQLITVIPVITPAKGIVIHMGFREANIGNPTDVNIDVFKIWGVQGNNQVCELASDTLINGNGS